MKSRNQTRELYTRRASLYERLFVDYLGWGKELATFFRSTDYLHPSYKVLDAGCGTGIVTRVLYQLVQEKGYRGVTFHAFDLTLNMLEIFQQWIDKHQARHIELRRADVLTDTLPLHWNQYDLIVSSTMLEYVPRAKVKQALTNLRSLLKEGGLLLVMITKHSFITRWLAEKWWKTNIYTAGEMETIFHAAGFKQISFKDFTPRWSNYIIVVQANK